MDTKLRNILFVGAGRRTQLASYFGDNTLPGIVFNLYSYELTDVVPIADWATVIIGKSYKDPDFLADVEKTIKEYSIDLVIPCQDEAVFRLSEASFKDKVLVSPYRTTEICYDKLCFKMSFMDYEFYPATEIGSPVVVKPRFGQSGRGIRYYESMYDLDYNPQTEVIQRKIEGQEWTVDCYFDKKCNWVDAVPRKRLRVFDGEVISSVTEYNKELYALCMRIGYDFSFRGPINMQFIEDKDGKFWLTEINARFGGGYTLSIASGMDVIALICRDYFDIEYEYKPMMWNSGLRVERALQDFYFSEEKCE